MLRGRSTASSRSIPRSPGCINMARPSRGTQGALPNHKNPWVEPPDPAIGRSRGVLTTKVHLTADGRGRLRGMMLTGGNVADTTMLAATLDVVRVPRAGRGRPRTRPDRVLADKAYPSKANRGWLRRHGIATTIPERDDQIAHCRKKPGRPIDFGARQQERYKGGNVVERCFKRLKQWRDRDALGQARPQLPRSNLPGRDTRLDQDQLNQHALVAWVRRLCALSRLQPVTAHTSSSICPLPTLDAPA